MSAAGGSERTGYALEHGGNLLLGVASTSQKVPAGEKSTPRKKLATSSLQDDPTTDVTESVTVEDIPSWLNIYLCAALGAQASVFHMQRGAGGVGGASLGGMSTPGKPRGHHARPVGASASSSTTGGVMIGTNISIHPQASPLICRHVFDALISLAKSFPSQFLPQTPPPRGAAADAGVGEAASGGMDADVLGRKDSETSVVCETTDKTKTTGTCYLFFTLD